VVVSRFFEAVPTIKAPGISILIAESALTNAARAADRLCAIARGEIIDEGGLARLRERGSHEGHPRLIEGAPPPTACVGAPPRRSCS
jgi:ABC-type branched-subunit amino acid transport system ATPase component